MGVGEARDDAAAVEVDALVRDERAVALAHVDAAADAIARDRERACEREPRVARAHAAVVEDHAAEGSPSLSSASVLPPPPPADEIDRRIAAFQAGLRRDGLDAALIVQSADLVYLSGTAQNAHLIVPGDGRAAAARAPRPRARARRERAAPDRAVHVAARPARGARLGRPARAPAARPRARRAPGRVLPALPRAPAGRRARPTACPRCGRRARARASGSSTRIRAACVQTPGAPWSTRRSCSCPGTLECDVLSELGHHMRLHGHEGTIRFRGINSEFLYGQVLAGESGGGPGPDRDAAARPGALDARRAGARRAGRCATATPSLIDISGLSEGYVSDQTRTFFIGHADPALLAAYETCRRILAECVALLRPGHARERALRARARGRRPRPGYAERFMGAGEGRVRFVGHCIGLELNEPPYLARGYAQPLEIGNVVAIEPKLAFTGPRRRRRREQLPHRRRRPGAAHGRDRGARDRVIDAGLYRRLFAELAAIGREPGGWNRMAWGPGEDAARDVVPRRRRRRSGSRSCRTRPRNLWAVEPGAGDGPFDAVGSHVDSVADGGAFDGALGVVAGSRRRRGRPPRGRRAAAARGRRDGRRGGAALRRRDLRLARARPASSTSTSVLARTRSRGQRPARPRGPARRHGRDAARRAGVPAARRLLDRGARRAGTRARRRARAARASRPRWPPASAGAARCAASPITPARLRWPGGATRSCPPRAPCWPRTSSPSPSRARSRPSGASARCRARPTRCRARRA